MAPRYVSPNMFKNLQLLASLFWSSTFQTWDGWSMVEAFLASDEGDGWFEMRIIHNVWVLWLKLNAITVCAIMIVDILYKSPVRSKLRRLSIPRPRRVVRTKCSLSVQVGPVKQASEEKKAYAWSVGWLPLRFCVTFLSELEPRCDSGAMSILHPDLFRLAAFVFCAYWSPTPTVLSAEQFLDTCRSASWFQGKA